MAEEKLHTCVLTVNPLHGPIPCEACAETPKCIHGWKLGINKCADCELVHADQVVAAARAVAECFKGSGALMVVSEPGRTLEARVDDLRAALAEHYKAGAYASVTDIIDTMSSAAHSLHGRRG
jgi:hypothetical protein